MQDNQVIYTEFDESVKPDFVTASQSLFLPPGTLAVEMLPAKEKTAGGILLSPGVLETHYDEKDMPVAGIEPSIGVVIGVGAETDQYPNIHGFQYGDHVIVRDGDGIYYTNLEIGNFFATGTVAVLGRTVPPAMGPGYIEDLPLEESIFAKFNEGVIEPLGDNIHIRKDAYKNESAIIHTPDHLQERTGKATIIAVGDKSTPCVYDPETLELRSLRAGDRVLYHPSAQWVIMDGVNRNDSFIRQSAVLALLAE